MSDNIKLSTRNRKHVPVEVTAQDIRERRYVGLCPLPDNHQMRPRQASPDASMIQGLQFAFHLSDTCHCLQGSSNFFFATIIS